MLVCGFGEAPQKIRGPGERAPPPHPPLWFALPPSPAISIYLRLSACLSFSACESCLELLLVADSGPVGWGLPSPDPCLLGSFFEAPNRNLEAGLSGGAECDSAWSGEGSP